MTRRAFVSRFSPNRTDPAVLEAIFVQRHGLAAAWFDRLRGSALTEVKHHLLAIGPRGCGKSHLVALLVGRLRRDPAVRAQARIAWLPEDEVTPSFWKFLLRILRALHAEYGDEFPPPPRDNLEDTADDRRTAVLTDYLLRKLAGRNLIVVVENLDDVLRGLKDEGQKRWRAFLQQHQVAATLATSQQLTDDMSHREKAFFGFFQVESLEPLTADEALLLLRRIAEHAGNADLAAFLQTAAGRARVRAIRHIAGGSHRVFIILSEFASRQNLGDLVTAFEELLDELTPYYQERLRWLPDQQREIVEFLCRQTRTVAARAVAAQLYLSDPDATTQLMSLKGKGYLTFVTDGHAPRYELAEPLMRLCVEVKDPQQEPIRLIVEFLRIWYDREETEARLRSLPDDADLNRRYLLAVLKAHTPGIPGPIQEALDLDLQAARKKGDQEELVRVLVELAATADSAWRGVGVAQELGNLGRHAEAMDALERATTLDPKSVSAWIQKGIALGELGRHGEALEAEQRATELDPKNAAAWGNKGASLSALGRHADALEAEDRATDLDPTVAAIWSNKGDTLNALGRHAEALEACDRACELEPKSPYPVENRGRAKLGLGRIDAAVRDFRQAIILSETHSGAHEGLAEAHIFRNDWGEAERALATRFRLPPAHNNPSRSQHLPDLIATLFRVSTAPDERTHWVNRLVDIAAKARNQVQSGEGTGYDLSPDPITMLSNALVRSLTNTAYTTASVSALDAWAEAWRQASVRHPDLSLAARLFEVGLRYVQTKVVGVLLDLLQEERSILMELFGLTSIDDV